MKLLLVILIAVLGAERTAFGQVDTAAARDARAALAELKSTYGQSADWRRWLRQPAILEAEYELQAGDRAQGGALESVAAILRRENTSYFQAEVFGRLATALESRAKELAPVPASEWSAACRACAANYAPVASETLSQSRQELARRLDDLAQRLPSLERPGDEWREFLYWPETRWLATSDSVDLATLGRLEIRWCGAPTIWSESPLVEASLAVRTYLRLLRSHLTRESEAQHAAAWNELAALVDSPERSSGAQAESIAAAVTRREQLGESCALTASIRREMSRPNIILRARNAWLQSLFARKIEETFHVDDIFAGARSIGSGKLTAATRCQVLPSGALGHWILRMEGSSQSTTTGYGDRVRVASRATTQVRAETPLTIDVRGLTAGRTTASAETAIVYDRVDAEGIRLRRSEATRRTHARRPQAEAEASAQARRSVTQRMEAQASEVAEKLSRPYRERLRDPQVDANRMPPEVRVLTSTDTLRWECRLEGPACFAAAAAPAEFDPEADVVLSFAASAIEEQSLVALGGRQLTADEFAKVLGQLLGDTSAATASGQDFQAVFAERPCDLQFAGGQVRARFHITSFESADVQYPAMTVEAIYQVEHAADGLALVRQGSLLVKPLARGQGDNQPPTGRQQTLRVAAQRKLNKALAERFVWNGPPQPAAGEEGLKLRVRGAQSENGWLQLALGAAK